MGKLFQFTVITDHKPLENLRLRARTDEELGDFTLYLSQYDFEIKYQSGVHNSEADCLSRNPVLEPNSSEEDVLVTVNLLSL